MAGRAKETRETKTGNQETQNRKKRASGEELTAVSPEETAQPEEISLEDAFARLEALLEQMEEEETTLEDSFQLYEEGMKLVKQCTLQLEEVEAKVQKLNADGTLEEFE